MAGFDDQVQAAQRDDELRKQLEVEGQQAAEQATFHRIEAERYERIARASLAGVAELCAVSPVAAVTIESLSSSPPRSTGSSLDTTQARAQSTYQ